MTIHITQKENGKKIFEQHFSKDAKHYEKLLGFCKNREMSSFSFNMAARYLSCIPCFTRAGGVFPTVRENSEYCYCKSAHSNHGAKQIEMLLLC